MEREKMNKKEMKRAYQFLAPGGRKAETELRPYKRARLDDSSEEDEEDEEDYYDSEDFFDSEDEEDY